MNYFGLTRAQTIAAVIGWSVGAALGIVCLEGDTLSLILSLVIAIPASLGLMWLGSSVE